MIATPYRAAPRCTCGHSLANETGTYSPHACPHDQVVYVERTREVAPDFSRMNRHDRRTAQKLARKYGWSGAQK